MSRGSSGERGGRRDGSPDRRSRHLDLTDEEILHRGLEAFAELSYAGASVRELARRMTVSHNFINDRFGSKENFWRAVVDNAITEPHEQVMKVFDTDADDVEKFKSIVRVFCHLAANRPYVNRIISDESAVDSDRLDHLYGKYTGQFLESFELLARRLMRAGRMPDMPMDVLYSVLQGPAIILSQKAMRQRIRGTKQISSSESGQSADVLANVLIRGLLSERGNLPG
jgi:AcrR family transcriptional regulator